MVNSRIFSYDIDERIHLINTIMGREPADILIVNVNVVSVTTSEILEDQTIVIKGRRIAGVGKYGNIHRLIGGNTLVINGENKYAIPGFIDPHIHIESSFLTPTGFAILSLKHGTTTVVADPHEVANVLGIEGVVEFINEASKLPLKILIDIPSCVPAIDPARNLETNGSILGVEDIEKLSSEQNISGLGEVMDFLSVIDANRDVLEKIRVAKVKDLLVNGHAPLLSGEKLDAYISAGIMSDHETVDYNEALEKLRKGMYVFIREGSAWKDLVNLSKLLLNGINDDLIAFTSDDLNVLDLYEKGHMDRIINEAIELGVDPVKAIKLATINPARYLKLEEHIGVIAPGRLADIVITDSIEYITPRTVLANGEIIYFNNELKKNFEKPRFSSRVLNTVRIGRSIKTDDLLIRVDGDSDYVEVNVIEVKPGSTITRRRVEEVRVENGVVKLNPRDDLMYAYVIDRHRGTGSIGKGFIKGLGFKTGAIAQTIAHDTHNLIVTGYSINDIVKAIERIVEIQGGIVIVDNGDIVSEIQLRYAGLMSIEEPEIVYQKLKQLVETVKERFGVSFEPFFMTLSLISLPVIPEIRLTDKGYVDVNEGRIISLTV